MSSKRRLLSACGATLLASGLLATSESAQANLLIDLRMPDNSKAANISAGQTLFLDVYAKVTSASAQSTAGFQELQGIFLSSPGTTNLLGTLAPAGALSGFPLVTVEGTSPFNATGAVPGAPTDLDADGDLDLGHANSDDPTGFTFIRSERPNFEVSHVQPTPPVTYFGQLVDAGAAVEWKIGKISFKAADSGNADGSTTNINFSYRKGASGSIFQSAALWFESTGSKDGFSSANMAVGTPVVLTLGLPPNPQWNVDLGGSWSTAGNWSGGVPNGATGVANFLGKITAARTVTLDGSKQVLTLNFDNANKYTIAPGSGGTLTVGNGTTGTISVAQGTHEVSAGLALSGNVSKTGPGTLIISGTQAHGAGSSLNVSQGNLTLNSNPGTAAGGSAATANLALTVSGTGSKITLGSNTDLKDLTISTASAGTQGVDLASPAGAGAFNALRVYSGSLAATKAALNAAVGNARTNPGDGIFDSTAHGGAGIGVAQIADAHGDQMVEVRATKVGDLNLDGSVTISDFIDLASNFNSSGKGWQEGDLNYDGSVTISDFIDLASNFNSSYTGEVWPISSADQQTLASFAASIGASVPEPGMMGVIAVAALGLLGRRRRRAS